MNPILQFHDSFVLWFVQGVFYAHALPWVPVAVVLLVGLPSHRVSARVVTWLATAFAVLCLVGYGALREAPLLGWVMVGCLAYRMLRSCAWIAPQELKSPHSLPVRRLRWMHPRAEFATGLLRDYLRIDPGAVYWFDMARAVRGLPLRRSTLERRAARAESPDQPAWRRRVFWPAALWLVETRIALYRRLPRYWRVPHAELALGEQHLLASLEFSASAAHSAMQRAETGDSFEDYRKRTPQTHREEHRKAVLHGWIYCRNREAIAEFLTFRQPWTSGERGLVDGAVTLYQLWQARSEIDRLWELEQQVADRSVSPARSSDAHKTLRRVPPSPRPVAVAGVDSEKDIFDDEPESDSLNSTATVTEPDAPLTDEELFDGAPTDGQTVVAPVPNSVVDQPAGPFPRSAPRGELLRAARQMLETFLGVEDAPEFKTLCRRVERLLEQPPTRSAALMLLMVVCIQEGGAGPAVDRQKIDLVHRLRQRFAGTARSAPHLKADRRLYSSMYVDMLFERGEYAAVRNLVTGRDEMTSYEWKVRADATLALASQLGRRDKLRDLLRSEAISCLFQAGRFVLWTPRYARLIVDGVTDPRSLFDLLDRHPVALGLGRPVSFGDDQGTGAASARPQSGPSTATSPTAVIARQPRPKTSVPDPGRSRP